MVAQVGFIYYSCEFLGSAVLTRLRQLLLDALTSDNPAFWWFEVWDLLRKLFLNCVIGLLTKTGANRIIAGLIVL